MNKNKVDIHRKSGTRFSDHGDSTVSLIGADDAIRIVTTPGGNNVGFTTSGGQSENTRKSLRELLIAMEKDNNESSQEGASNEELYQSRHDDERIGDLRVERNAGDMYISAYTTNKFHNYISFGLSFTQSKHTRDALIQLLLAMKEDEKTRPQ